MTPRELWHELVREAREVGAAGERAADLAAAAWSTFLDTPIEAWALPLLGVLLLVGGINAIWEHLQGGDPDEEDRRLLREEREREEARRARELDDQLERQMEEEEAPFVGRGPWPDD